MTTLDVVGVLLACAASAAVGYRLAGWRASRRVDQPRCAVCSTVTEQYVGPMGPEDAVQLRPCGHRIFIRDGQLMVAPPQEPFTPAWTERKR